MTPRISSFRTAPFDLPRAECFAPSTPPRYRPLTRAIALLLATGGMWGTAHAQQAFSNAWFAARGAAQATASQTGRLPNGMPVTSLMNPSAQQQQANAQLQRSIANLGTAAQSIAAMQAAQANARAAAANSDTTIPDGLAEGGLKVDTNSLTKGWINAQSPTQTTSNGKTHVSIQQTNDKAILNWETFNVGRNTSVDFAQQRDWAVLNRVNDPHARPSQIQGQIRGDGTVLVVNRNGVIFGGTSQVDVRNLVAAATRITDEQFRNNGIYSTQSGGGYLPAFTDAGGKLTVEAGARITTATPGSVTEGGGYVLLLGREVENAGTISTTKGQVQLAAGDNFIVRRGYGTSANAGSTTRGNEVSPQGNSGPGTVINTGLLSAPEGDVTLAGHDVRQAGVITASTTVNARGTVHLLNASSDTTGRVSLAPNAVTAVLIGDDGVTALDSQRDALAALKGNALANGQFDNLSTLADRRDQGRVEIVSGGDAVFEAGSLTLATGGQIAVSATRRAFVADGARMDVAGAVGVRLAMDSNNLLVNVQGNELRDAPADRDAGKLSNNNVWIDTSGLRYVPAGTGGAVNDRWYSAGGLFEVGGYLGTVGHRIGEWAAPGGTVVLRGSEVVTQAGSQINLSGGSIDTITGYLNQTWLKGANGQLYNASTAPVGGDYTGVYKGFEQTHARWGENTTEYFFTPLIGPQQVLRNGYTVGRDAGQLIVSAPTAVLEGDIVAAVYNGPQQTGRRADGVTDGYKLGRDAIALPGKLVAGDYTSLGLTGGLSSDMRIGDVASITQGMNAADALSADRANTLSLDAAYLNAQGLGGLRLVSTKRISLDAPLLLADGAQVDLTAPDVGVHADITSHAGSLAMGNVMRSVLTQDQAPFWVALTDANGQAHVDIDNRARIDLSGRWLNQRDGSGDGVGANAALALLDGGTLNVATTGGVTFAAGSLIDVSAGAAVLSNGKTRGGRGGDVSLVANDDTRYRNPDGVIDRTAPLVVDGKINAYGFTGGGTLTLKAGQAVVIGNDAAMSGGRLAAGTPASVSVRLAEDVEIPAGSRMPVDYLRVLSKIPSDVPLDTAYLPTLSAGNTVVSAADWLVPSGVTMALADGSSVTSGGTLHAGSRVSSMASVPAGTVIPSAVFPTGIPISPILQASYKAGDVVTTSQRLPSGTLIPAGTQFTRDVAISGLLTLSPDRFASGFGNYRVSSNTGMEITAALTAAVPVFRWDAGGLIAATGSRAQDVAQLWLPPTYADDPVAGRFTQRSGANIALTSLYDFNLTQGASISVDPGQAVAIYANRQATIEGSITAHGGSISVASVPNAPNGTSYNDGYGLLVPTRSIWIGDSGVLDVSAQAVTGTDTRGRHYGVVPAGGSITLGGSGSVASDSFIVVRPGARLDASGTSGLIDVGSASGAQPTAVASDGGVIALYSANGMYLDGVLRAAAGGAGASGGLLSLNVLSHMLSSALPTSDNPFAIGEIPEEMQKVRNITVVQNGRRSALADDLKPGQRDPALKFGEATIGVDKIRAGGFDQLALATHDVIVFDGDVDLPMNRSIVLSGGVLGANPANPHSHVHLSAPYVKLDGWTNDVSGTIAPLDKYYTGLNTIRESSIYTVPDSSFHVDADLLDVTSSNQFGVHGLQGSGSLFFDGFTSPNTKPAQDARDRETDHLGGPHVVDAAGFADVLLRSTGDVRFGTGRLRSQGNVTIDAAQVYPFSGASAVLYVGVYQRIGSFGGLGSVDWNNDATITFRKRGTASEQTTPSVFGDLAIVAPNIDQGGVLRAPLGTISFNNILGNAQVVPVARVVLRDGSLTSTSASGLIMPFGGTTDGVTYQGADGTVYNLGATSFNDDGRVRLESGLMFNANAVVAEPGAVLDVSGGGTLLGAGFIAGRGGSVNVLTTPLVSANPVNAAFSAAGNKVYAIVPGYASAYAPSITTRGAGDPSIGQQVTIPTGVPGLPAGTYTLLPSSYALLPGAYRVELGGRSTVFNSPSALPNGAILASGYLSVANTGVRDVLPTQIVLSAGKATRSYSQFNETGYADFLRSQASLFNGVRPRLPVDAGSIQLVLGSNDGRANNNVLSFAGTALFGGATGGIGGTLLLSSYYAGTLDVTSGTSSIPSSNVSVASADINAFHAPVIILGGQTIFNDPTSGGDGSRVYFSGNSNVNLLDGAVLRAGQVFLAGNRIDIASGATIDTRGLGSNGVDSTLGFAYSNRPEESVAPAGPAVLAVANGWYNFLPFTGTGKIHVGDGATLLTEGTIALGAAGGLSMGDANLGARYLSVTQDVVNIGTSSSLSQAQAAGRLPTGWNLTQGVLDRLLRPSVFSGVPALEQLTVVAGGSVNLVGDVSLDVKSQTNDHALQFVVNTPAIYGLGGSGEVARISADAFVWNGIRTGNGGTGTGGVPFGSKDPAAILANGPGTGQGRLSLSARTVTFGDGDHMRRTDGVNLSRYAVGFQSVDISASDFVAANNDGSLQVGRSRDANAAMVDGNLTITTPLLSAQRGAIMTYQAGGAVTLAAPVGAGVVDTSRVKDLGGTITIKGDSIALDTAVGLPSGKLTLDATQDVRLGDHAIVDLSGRHLVFYDKSVDSWGGDLILRSAQGDISQAGGSRIDVSAAGNDAGTITASATDTTKGTVSFDGALAGASGIGYTGGQFNVQAQTLNDFAGLNDRLNAGGVFGARSFDLKRGDLVVNDGVKARFVSISVDGGSLTVHGTVDASGDAPGTIRLAARDNLTLSSGAVLDTHSTRLKTDSRGTAIEADNTGHVELTSVDGTLTLSGGTTIDMRSPDGVTRSKLEINAPRRGLDDIAINASDGVNVRGAGSIAVNAFRTYLLPDGSSIDQSWLDGAHVDSRNFIDAARVNGNLQTRLAGLSAYGPVFHLRPGVEVRSQGSLSTTNDLDFSGYRYGPGANPLVLGSGEPGKLVIRAGGDLKINGSITDGFAPPPDSPDKDGFQTLIPRMVATQDTFPTDNVRLAEAWTIPSGAFYRDVVPFVVDVNGNLYSSGDTIPSGTTIDVSGFGVPFGWQSGITIPALAIPGQPRPVYALAQPLAPGSLSWSMRLVSGADTAAADSRALKSAASLSGAGNMTLSDSHFGGSDGKAVASVLRTGTGDLEMLVGGNYAQATPYGVYTAGTPIVQTGTSANAPYNPARGRLADDGTVLGAAWSGYENTLGPQYMYYMEHGGDFLLNAQGNINGSPTFDSREIGGWLWRQGGRELGQLGAWGINFGSYTATPAATDSPSAVHLSTFSGMGTLGGGNATINAGGNIGDTGAVVLAVGASGRAATDGTVAQTGGGTLAVKAGGNVGTAGNQFVNVRGDTTVAAGDFGTVRGQNYGYDGSLDPRSLDTLQTYSAVTNAGGAFAPADGTVTLRARGDAALGDTLDPGRVRLLQQTAGATPGDQVASWFVLWRPDTALNIFGAGGSVSPVSQLQGGGLGGTDVTSVFLPPVLRATAGNGDIFLTAGTEGAGLMLPSPVGQLTLLAAGSVIAPADMSNVIGPLATSLDALATPSQPGWVRFRTDSQSSRLVASNFWSNPDQPADGTAVWKAYSSGFLASGNGAGYTGIGGLPFVFGPNTVSNASAFGNGGNSSIYALGGDILNIAYGQIYTNQTSVNGINTATTFYRAAKPVDMRSGGDIVNTRGLILQNNATDVSTIAATGNVIYVGTSLTDPVTQASVAGLRVAGPGTLEVSAGKSLYEGSGAAIESLGALVDGDRRAGASVVLQAGIGAGAPATGHVDWDGFARRYLDPANLAAAGQLATQPGKVAKTYERELVDWLVHRFGYSGSATDALTWFLTLPQAQQRIFLRTVYYAELTAGGREYNDASGPRRGSYLRGREAIASLFPDEPAYRGSITALTAASGVIGSPAYKISSGYVHTDAGGDIQILAPGGQVVVGSEGIAPGGDAGLITQGQGNIQVYAKGSLLLGLARVMTTFGGDILAWSAEGDINAGRGAKTTVLYTPPKRVYDDMGNVTLSSQTPSSGAGIATLAPIPEVPAGDIDLIAPLGTVDAGEAGIRYSGNINVAALQVVNAANISGTGKASGLPVIAAVNVGALTNASATATQAAVAAQDAVSRERVAQRQSMPSVFTVRMLGADAGASGARPDDGQTIRPISYRQDSAVQVLGDARLGPYARGQLTADERKSLGL